MKTGEHVDDDAIREAVRRQRDDPEEHDLTLIARALDQTPDERLAANEAFVEFLCRERNAGPLVE